MKFKSTRFSAYTCPPSLALILVAAGSALPASAQDTSLMEEEVVVSGFRTSLRAALDVKRNAVGSVDSILAEDIADFPDTNLAESLQRIPGIAITREAGEGREISVRGLAGDFTRVMVNNAMGHSLSAGSGGARTSRTFDFNVFASELFNRIDVYKTTSAELEEGSLGATVNLQTAKPFDYDAFELVLNGQAFYNEQSEETLPRTSGLISFTNEDETLGGLLSVAYAERSVSDVGAETGRWENDTFGSCSTCSNPAEEAAVYAAYHPRFPRYADKTHDQDRLGITGAFQFAPSDRTLITADLLFATVDATRKEPFMEAISLARTGATGVQETDVSNFTLAGNTLIAATMDGVDTRSEAFVSNWDSEFTQFQIKLEQDIGEKFHVDVMYATSESVLNNRETTMIFEHYSDGDERQYGTYAESADAVIYDYRNMLKPNISYNFDTRNPANWEVSEFRDRQHYGKSGSDTFKLDGDYFLNDNLTLKAGVSMLEYTFNQTASRADRAFSSADESDGLDGSACGIGFAVDDSMGSVVSAGNVSFFLADESSFDQFRNSGCWPSEERPQDFRDITEENTGLYVQLDFDYDLAGHALRGNFGARDVTTELTTNATTFVEGVETPVTVNHEYSDTLPALNVAYNITDDLIGRFGWASVMSRPNLGTLSPFGSVTIFGIPAVSFGNPFIEPFRADNTDLALEWYFSEDSLLSLAYFMKDVESFPTSETVVLPWSQVGLPDALLGAQLNDLRDADFEVSRTVNGGGASLDGFEIQYQQNFTFLPIEWMQNLGVIANYTKVSSEVDETGLPLEGQSDDSYNFTLFYEDDAFSTRIAYSYRSEYTTDNNDDPELIRYREATTNVDFSASYNINDHFKATVEAINITDEPILDYMSPGIGRIIGEQTTGRQWLFGVTYKY